MTANYELPVFTAWVKGELKAAVHTSLVDQGVLVVLGSDSPGLVAAGEDRSGLPEVPDARGGCSIWQSWF